MTVADTSMGVALMRELTWSVFFFFFFFFWVTG